MTTLLGPGALTVLLVITTWITLAALINVWRYNLRPLLLLAMGSGMLALAFGLRLLSTSETDVWTALSALLQLMGLISVVIYGRRFSAQVKRLGFGWRQLLLFARR